MILDGFSLDLRSLSEELSEPSELRLGPEAIDRINDSRRLVDRVVQRDETVYGVNTGFGKLANTRIPADKLRELQLNLLRSHAAGVGPYFPEDIVRLILILKINSLARGYSGIRVETVETLVRFYNKGLLPAIRSQGSVGASGDLAPLADLALPLVGEGSFLINGEAQEAESHLIKAGIVPLKLSEKEGLSLINGTQVSAALAVKACLRARRFFFSVNAMGAFTTEVLMATNTAFRPEIQEARNQAGQKKAAEILEKLMENSGYRAAHEDCEEVQDFYSIRCMPQVHGSLWDILEFSENIVSRELNSTTDNPLTFTDSGEILSGGNFHAAPLAHAMDYMAIAITDVAAMSERRIAASQDTLQSHLPMFLSEEPGLNSGYMIAQVTAAALASENKILSHPASVDTIPTSANQEDHVSMAPAAGHKLNRILDGAESILAIEYLCAAQASDLNDRYKLAPNSQGMYDRLRSNVPFAPQDTVLSENIDRARASLLDFDFETAVERLGSE